MPKAGRPATTAAHRSGISALNTLVGALGRAIVWCRYAGGGGTAMTPGAGRGLPGGDGAAPRRGRAGVLGLWGGALGVERGGEGAGASCLSHRFVGGLW